MSQNKQLTNERLKIWLNFWKWLISSVIITGVISIATIMINAKHKDTELEIKINQEEKEYLTSFLEKALDNNLEKRKRFAQYFANVTTSKKYKEGWKNYLNMINKEINDVKENLTKEKKELLNKSGEELEQTKKRIAALESELFRSKPNNTMCRKAEIIASIDDKLEKTNQTACRDMNGQWHLQTPNNMECRKAEITAVTDGKTEKKYSIACRDMNGRWQLETNEIYMNYINNIKKAEILAVIDGRTERTYTTAYRDPNNRWFFFQHRINPKNTACQKAEILAVIDGRTEETYTTACHDMNNQWQIQW